MTSDDKKRSADEYKRDLEVYQDRARSELREQIRVWDARAEMAKRHGNRDLLQLATEMATKFRTALNELGGPKDSPDTLAGVPRKPYPLVGGAAVALPLPEPEESSDDG